MAAISGRRAMQSLNGCHAGRGSRPWLRGTISYHAPARARGRSATSGNNCDRVRSGRNWLSAMASFNSSVSSGAASPVCRKSSHCLKMIAARSVAAKPGPGEHARAFDRVEGEVDAGILLEFDIRAARSRIQSVQASIA